MLENMRAVSNPLSIIAIFAALAEVAGTVVLALVDKTIQGTFVWFVMLFPILIVVLFFLTLNFNPKVLYAPSDFRDEDNFLQTMLGAKWIESSLTKIDTQIEEAKQAIAEEAKRRIGATAAESNAKLQSIVDRYLKTIQESVESTRETAVDLNIMSFDKLPHSAFQAKIMHILRTRNDYVPLSEISNITKMGEQATRRSLEKLQGRKIVEPNSDASAFRLADL
ncbi:hypothetical protein [Ramlibacter tataouinensis]|uniref:Uncharacterized protein n=1 Tax=Ramlibacter tataouinensis (strain ATCC BAA-407 / DSM 14655 / LMG 21543 / TTB310) TaxID=365046 RepID=F5Y3L6_RAMTT|nr:hypothetical protein [Ramlibacter tataouinensis]AEG92490.1 hypothetical protein Rta_14040 [Ramlibacter tataouinensis TTB310]